MPPLSSPIYSWFKKNDIVIIFGSTYNFRLPFPPLFGINKPLAGDARYLASFFLKPFNGLAPGIKMDGTIIFHSFHLNIFQVMLPQSTWNLVRLKWSGFDDITGMKDFVILCCEHRIIKPLGYGSIPTWLFSSPNHQLSYPDLSLYLAFSLQLHSAHFTLKSPSYALILEVQ